jgi:triacylglycerol esterase/lipase EstA (alpha/beta hydrolase family)
MANRSENGLNAFLRDALGGQLLRDFPPHPRRPLPVPYSFAIGLLADLLYPGSNPPGSNDWSRPPSPEHPNPVILVHGLLANMTNSWQAVSPFLTNYGYSVFTLTYGLTEGDQFGGRAPIESSAAELARFVDQVLAATGAAQVDIVGHSLGGVMPRYYLKELGGAPKVRTLVGLAPPNHGTTLDGIVALVRKLGLEPTTVPIPDCPSCSQLPVGSGFLTSLNSGGDTLAGVSYTVIATRYDELVTPYQSAFLTGPEVRNLTVQDSCDEDFSEHLAVIYDPVVLHLILGALDPANATTPPCVFVPPFLG